MSSHASSTYLFLTVVTNSLLTSVVIMVFWQKCYHSNCKEFEVCSFYVTHWSKTNFDQTNSLMWKWMNEWTSEWYISGTRPCQTLWARKQAVSPALHLQMKWAPDARWRLLLNQESLRPSSAGEHTHTLAFSLLVTFLLAFHFIKTSFLSSDTGSGRKPSCAASLVA